MNEQPKVGDVKIISPEEVIENKLVEVNVTKLVLAELKEKYGSLVLKSIDDKESYLEIKDAAKVCAKLRTATVKICKDEREPALRYSKACIAKEREVVGEIELVENHLDAEIARFDENVKFLEEQEKKRKGELYINRQAILTKMGATYSDGNFTFGEVSYEANLIEHASESIWEESTLPAFTEEYNKIETIRIQAEKEKERAEAAIKAEQEKLRQEQEKFQKEKQDFEKQQQAAANEQIEKQKKVVLSRYKQLNDLGMQFHNASGAYVFEDINIDNATEICLLDKGQWDVLIEKITPVIAARKEAIAKLAEDKRIADIESARLKGIKEAEERQAEDARNATEMAKQAEEKRLAELDAAGDKVKWEDFIKQLEAITTLDMRSGQYRKKMQIAKEKIEEILAL